MLHLGHTIQPRQLAVDNKNWKPIRKSLPLTDQTVLTFFLRICIVKLRFVFIIARVAAPLNVRTRKSQLFEFELNIGDLDAFQKLKKLLMFSPLLSLPRHQQRYNLDKDACDYQMRCALLQQRPSGDELSVRY